MVASTFWLQLVLCCGFIVSSIATISRGNARELSDEVVGYRLPTTLLPKHYVLYFHPDLSTGNFSGQERITIEVQEATNQIVLHAYELEIISIYVLNYEVVSYALDADRELLIINMASDLPAGRNITLGLAFRGQMEGKLVGLYSSSYQTEAGVHRTISSSQFEPTYARQAFPCFDEPAMKATFQISVTHPTGTYHALSNMDQSDSINLGENTEAIFSTTVPMSTYLACIIVSDFESKSTTVSANGIGNDFELRAFATPHQLDKVQFALDFGAAVTEYYIQSYKVAYPLPKLDMAAIPNFGSNAMEHWGLVTYRETALLYDENYSSTWNKQSIAAVLAHEIAHMWFGNLVTMKWWDDLWLNEGFARYMQYKGVNAVFADWGMMEQFQIVAVHPVLAFDAKLSSHPIVQTVDSSDEIIALFDTISYEKGGSVIRMLENFVGTERFEEAVTNYLEKFQFSNAVTDDFLTEVDNLVEEHDVKLLMRTWTEQMGYPVLNVTRSSNGGYTITQQRFLSNKDSYDEVHEETPFDYKWTIPITYYLDSYGSSVVNSFVFSHTEDSVSIGVTALTDWIKVNVHQMGYYRVNYEESIWNAIIKDLIDNPSTFDVADRAHLLNDVFALADADQLSYAVALDMTAYLAKENDFVPWYVASQKLQALGRSLMFTESYSDFLVYARELILPIYTEVGWTVDEDNHLRNRLRVSVLTAACALELPDCLTQAAQRLQSWIENPSITTKPSPDLREIVYYYGMQKFNSVSMWELLLEQFKSETDASEKLKLMYGLSGVQDPQLLYRFLMLASDESIVRSQDYFTCVQNIAANPVGEPLVWHYYRENWRNLVERFGLSNRYLGRLIASITSNFAKTVRLEELQQFFANHPDAGAGTSSRQQALETVKYNIQWRQQNAGDLTDWLSANSI